VMSREVYMEGRAGADVDELLADYGEVALAHFARRLDSIDPEQLRRLRKLAEESEGGGAR